MTENGVFVGHFSKILMTRTQISSDGGLDASEGGAVAPKPSPGVITSKANISQLCTVDLSEREIRKFLNVFIN